RHPHRLVLHRRRAPRPRPARRPPRRPRRRRRGHGRRLQPRHGAPGAPPRPAPRLVAPARRRHRRRAVPRPRPVRLLRALPVLGPSWTGAAGPALALGLAYPVGLVASTGICLPAFYFFGLLAGVRASLLQVTAHVLTGKAATALLLLGLLPIYLAVTLGLRVF